jgi:hypothetical protein
MPEIITLNDLLLGTLVAIIIVVAYKVATGKNFISKEDNSPTWSELESRRLNKR